MADDKFDSIVVGAGPAGISAAIIMARAGLNVAVLERGEYAGAKNVQGAVLYSKMLQDVIPDFWKDCPLERAIVEERVFVLTEKAGLQIGYKSAEYDVEPANCYTIIRTPFDRWYANMVIACDGVNSILAQKAGLQREWKPNEVALGIKEVLGLPREKIEDRFC